MSKRKPKLGARIFPRFVTFAPVSSPARDLDGQANPQLPDMSGFRACLIASAPSIVVNRRI